MVQNEAANRIKEWTKLLQEADASGLTRKQWCEQNGIPQRKFYYWQKRIRGEQNEDGKDADQPASKVGTFCELDLPAVMSKGTIAQPGEHPADALVLECGSFRLQIPQAFLVEVLKNA